MVSGLGFAVDFPVVDFFNAPLPLAAGARRLALEAPVVCFLEAAVVCFFDVDRLPAVAAAPDDTRVECLTR